MDQVDKMQRSRQHNITAHRLGVAKSALRRISECYGDQWDSPSDVACALRDDANRALKEIKQIGEVR